MTELPDGWKESFLGDAMADCRNGLTYRNEPELGGAPVSRIETISQGVIDFSRVGYGGLTTDGNEKYLLSPGDILFSHINSMLHVGKVAIYREGMPELLHGMNLLRITPANDFQPEFLFYMLQSAIIREQIWGKAKHAVNQASINIKELKSVKIVKPPLSEQHKIVEILEDHLSRLDAALADVKQAKVKAAQFRRSLLQAAFTGNLGSDGTRQITELPNGWELKRLSDCLEKLKSGKKAERGWSPQCLSHPSTDENVWGVLKTTSVQMGEYKPEYNKELPQSLEPKPGLEVNSGDFLVTTTGPRNRCGIVCYVNKTRKKLIFSGKILRFRVNENFVLPNLLMYQLMTPHFQNILDKMKVGTSDSSVSIGNQQILDLEIVVPPITEQQKIVKILEEYLSRLDASVALADAMEKQSAGLRRSLLQAAFTGQLTKEVASV